MDRHGLIAEVVNGEEPGNGKTFFEYLADNDYTDIDGEVLAEETQGNAEGLFAEP